MSDLISVRKIVAGIVGKEKSDEVFAAISDSLPIYEDVYEQLTYLLEPYVGRTPPGAQIFVEEGRVLPASVVDSVTILLEDWHVSNSAKSLSAIDNLNQLGYVYHGGSLWMPPKKPLEAANDAQCEIPPFGWHCTREGGHKGPCAAWPTLDLLESLHGQIERLEKLNIGLAQAYFKLKASTDKENG